VAAASGVPPDHVAGGIAGKVVLAQYRRLRRAETNSLTRSERLALAFNSMEFRDAPPARRYAQIVGPTVVVIGIVGLILGEQSLLDVLNIDIAEDIIHLVTGGLLTYVGFAKTDGSVVRAVVGALGVVYLLVGLVSFAEPNPLGLFPSEYSTLDNLIHLALGVLGIGASLLSGGKATTARPAPR
jgi:hypothetical protein